MPPSQPSRHEQPEHDNTSDDAGLFDPKRQRRRLGGNVPRHLHVLPNNATHEPVVLATNRILLRPWRPEDVDPYTEICQNPNVMRYIGTGATLDRSAVERRLEAMTASWHRNGYGLFALERINDSAFLGFCGLSIPTFAPQLLPCIEIGWRLGEEFWGNGYATEAAEAVMDWHFSRAGSGTFTPAEQERLYAVIHTDNIASQRVARRLGMVRESFTTIGQPPIKVHVYRLDREAWFDIDDDVEGSTSRHPSAGNYH